jgi:hypothetical protein
MEIEKEELLRENFDNEIRKASSGSILIPEIRKKKIILWAIRTTIAGILYYIFWEYSWVRVSLYFYAPFNLLGLISIFGWNYVLNKKIKNMHSKITKLEHQMEEE